MFLVLSASSVHSSEPFARLSALIYCTQCSSRCLSTPALLSAQTASAVNTRYRVRDASVTTVAQARQQDVGLQVVLIVPY
jgi:hypothetical protein